MENSQDPITPALVYGLEDRVPFGAAILVSAQQVAAMVVGTITPPLLLASILKFSPADTAYFVSMALLASALGTFLQTTRPGGWIGSGLLSVTGTSFAFLQPLIQAGQAGGLALMFGMSLATAPVMLILAPFLPKLRRVFPTLISGIVVLLIGLALIPEAMRGIVAPPVPNAPIWAGAVVAMVVIAVVIVAQAIGRPWARLAGVVLGIAAGFLVCRMGGWLAPMPAGESAWFTIPRLLPHGIAFRWELFVPFAFIYLVSLIEAMGDMTATAQLSGLDTRGAAHGNRMRGGIFADGLTCLITAFTGAFPSTTYAQNNGVIQITGVASRRIGPYIVAILALLGMFPVVGRWVTAMPPAVLGALALLLFGLVAVSGLRLILSTGLTQRDALIVALALAVGLGASSQPAWLHSLPVALRTILESGISAGGITAIVLNLLLPSRDRPVQKPRREIEATLISATME